MEALKKEPILYNIFSETKAFCLPVISAKKDLESTSIPIMYGTL